MPYRKNTLRLTVLLLATLFSIFTHAQARQKFLLPDDVSDRAVTIISEGTRITGHIFTPKSSSVGKALPTIVMAHGWGGTQALLRRDASEFAQAGFLVLSFDYRGWGESDSRVILTQAAADHTSTQFTAEVRAIREVVNAEDMVTDWLNVLHWAQGEPQIDGDNIGVWGSSMAGGYVIYAAAHDPRVKAVHSQVTGVLGTQLWGMSPDATKQATQMARGEIGYPEPRADFGMGTLRGAPILHRFARFTPESDILKGSNVALQIVLAEEEEYGGNPLALSTIDAYKGPKNLVIVKGIGHYGIYTKGRKQSHQLAEGWFSKFLKRK